MGGAVFFWEPIRMGHVSQLFLEARVTHAAPSLTMGIPVAFYHDEAFKKQAS